MCRGNRYLALATRETCHRKCRFCAGRAGSGSMPCPVHRDPNQVTRFRSQALVTRSASVKHGWGPSRPGHVDEWTEILHSDLRWAVTRTHMRSRRPPLRHRDPGPGPFPHRADHPDNLCFLVPMPAACTASSIQRGSGVVRRRVSPPVRAPAAPGVMPSPGPRSISTCRVTDHRSQRLSTARSSQPPRPARRAACGSAARQL